MARPRKQVDVVEVLRLRLEGLSWPDIAARMRLGLGTVYRAYRKAHAAIAPFQNPKVIG
jgi:DNA-directed RNA polymerase specialized sigma24 family protein